MGHGHFSPTSTTGRFKQIADYRQNHVDTPQHEDKHLAREEHRRKTQRIKELFTNKYAFRERNEWLSDYEKLIGETRHGAQLRQIFHPSGTTIYYAIVVEKDIHEPNSHNLALKHMNGYWEELKQVLSDLYGTVRAKNGAWTSHEVEV